MIRTHGGAEARWQTHNGPEGMGPVREWAESHGERDFELVTQLYPYIIMQTQTHNSILTTCLARPPWCILSHHDQYQPERMPVDDRSLPLGAGVPHSMPRAVRLGECQWLMRLLLHSLARSRLHHGALVLCSLLLLASLLRSLVTPRGCLMTKHVTSETRDVSIFPSNTNFHQLTQVS